MVIIPVLFFFYAANVHAKQEIAEVTFASESWVQATEENGTGLYWDIFRAIYEPENIKVKFEIRSYISSINMMELKKVDAMVGSYADEIENGIYPEHHFAVDVVQALFLKSKIADWKGQESLKDRNVGWIEGYAYDEYLTVPVKKKEIVTRDNLAKMLQADRFVFFLDAKGDLDALVKNGTLDSSLFERQTILKLKLYTVFRKDERGKRLAQLFDKGMKRLLESGQLKNMYIDYIKNKGAGFTFPY